MPNLKPMQLARPDMKIPMPDRGGRLFSADGETVDLDSGFYATLVADGDIVAALDPQSAKPTKGKRT